MNDKKTQRYFDENGNEVFIEEEKVKPAKKNVRYYLNQVCDFIRENKDVILLLTPVAIAGNRLVKNVRKTDTRHVYEDRQYYYYDPQTGIRWKLKKPLNNRQNEELMLRKLHGESIYSILADIGCLK